MNRKPLLASKSVEEKLNEISKENVEEKDIPSSEILENTESTSIIDSLNETIKIYKRVGFDLNAQIDDNVEHVANNILKDRASKKQIFNEIMEIGWPIWERKLKAFLEKSKKSKKI